MRRELIESRTVRWMNGLIHLGLAAAVLVAVGNLVLAMIEVNRKADFISAVLFHENTNGLAVAVVTSNSPTVTNLNAPAMNSRISPPAKSVSTPVPVPTVSRGDRPVSPG